MTERRVVVRRFGRERQPVAIVDDFAADPEALRNAADAATFVPASHHYPGLRAPLPPGYFAANAALIGQLLRELFGLTGAKVIDASFSIVTTPPAALTIAQRIPHVDAIEAGRIALVHYLGPADTDGTAFFRHRATGFETISVARSTNYLARLNAELREHEPDARYLTGDTPLFEHIGTVEARHNRAIFYRSTMLHSGAITAGRPLPATPRDGRLTVTGFLAGASN